MNILICTNGKKHSQEAIRFTGQLFQVEKPKVTLFHVANSRGTESRDKEKEILQQGEKILLESGISRVTFQIKKAENVASSIVQEVEQSKYDLLVMGSRGVSDIIPGVSQYLLGDIPREVVLQADISSLTVPEPKSPEKILIAIDGSDATQRILHFWGNLEKNYRKLHAGSQKHRIVLLNVIPELYERFSDLLNPIAESQLQTLETLPGKRTQYLYDAKELLKSYEVDAQIRLREGDVAEEMLKESERDYDLIILRRSSRKKYALGPYAKRIVEESKIPVLIMKT